MEEDGKTRFALKKALIIYLMEQLKAILWSDIKRSWTFILISESTDCTSSWKVPWERFTDTSVRTRVLLSLWGLDGDWVAIPTSSFWDSKQCYYKNISICNKSVKDMYLPLLCDIICVCVCLRIGVILIIMSRLTTTVRNSCFKID